MKHQNHAHLEQALLFSYCCYCVLQLLLLLLSGRRTLEPGEREARQTEGPKDDPHALCCSSNKSEMQQQQAHHSGTRVKLHF